MLLLEGWDGLSEGMASGGLRLALPGRPIRLPAAVPPVPRSGVLHLRTHAGLARQCRIRLCPPDVSARTLERLSRTRRRMAPGPLALDPGLPARRPAFFRRRAPPDPRPHAQRGTTRE